MTTTNTMLETHPRAAGGDLGQLSAAIDQLVQCAITCSQCADACLSEDNVADLVQCIGLNLDCADICSATARVISRQAAADRETAKALLQACVSACRACGDECEGHADHMEHCRMCAEQCRSCEQACQQLVDSTS